MLVKAVVALMKDTFFPRETKLALFVLSIEKCLIMTKSDNDMKVTTDGLRK
jgi:hypothetical protein